jgi:hypothetical protein
MRLQRLQLSTGRLPKQTPSLGSSVAPLLVTSRNIRQMANNKTVSILKPANRQGNLMEDIRISGPNIDLHVLPDNLKKDCVLFYCKETAPLAEKIRDASDGKVELGEINWK